MKKIAILGLHADRNLGDQIICQIVMKLYQKYYNEKIEWTKVDLRFYHTSLIALFQNKKRRIIYLFFHRFFKILTISRFALFHDMRIKYLSYEMEELLKGADSAIIAGGVLFILSIMIIMPVSVLLFLLVNVIISLLL